MKNNGNGNRHKETALGYELMELDKKNLIAYSTQMDLNLNNLVNQSEISKQESIEDAVRIILKNVGEDPDRDGLLNTPHRVQKMYGELLSGYTTDPVALVNDALFDVDYQEMVIVRDIELQSLCEHHMLPFIGKAHVAYLPNKKVLGLSKIPRIVDMFARRLQVQERLTSQIADFLEELLQPEGVVVVVEAAHMCSTLRGVKKANARMVTHTMRGQFKTDRELRRDFMEHISRPISQELY
jgi:GTP cyclohydrolase I